MYRLKYSNKREYADFFAKCARMRYSAWIKDIGIEAIVPVPLYKAKKRRRGYNQAESFAKALGRAWNLPVNKDLVYRVRNTTPQKGLSTKERKENLEKAFCKGKSTIRYNTVLLVDDIYTTGSTAEAVASELFQRGIKQVYFLSICIGE
jgi:ComF family protein